MVGKSLSRGGRCTPRFAQGRGTSAPARVRARRKASLHIRTAPLAGGRRRRRRGESPRSPTGVSGERTSEKTLSHPPPLHTLLPDVPPVGRYFVFSTAIRRHAALPHGFFARRYSAFRCEKRVSSCGEEKGEKQKTVCSLPEKRNKKQRKVVKFLYFPPRTYQEAFSALWHRRRISVRAKVRECFFCRADRQSGRRSAR